MLFGSDEFYHRLLEDIPKADGGAAIYTDLFNVIEQDVMRWIASKKNYNEEDIKDVLQEVNLRVFKGLPAFLTNSEYKTEQNRQNWLNSIVRGAIADSYEKGERVEISDTHAQDCSKSRDCTNQDLQETSRRSDRKTSEAYSLDQNGGQPSGVDEKKEKKYMHLIKPVKDLDMETGLDSELRRQTDAWSPEKQVTEKYPGETIIRLLKRLFSLNYDPDRLMAFCYSKMIIPLEQNKKNGKSGKPRAAAERLEGMRLEEVLICLKRDFSDSLQIQFSDRDFEDLEEKLNREKQGVKWKDREFRLSPRTITEASNRIQPKLDQDAEEILMIPDKNMMRR